MSETPLPTQALLGQIAWVRALARELVRDGGEAEDLAQETLLRVLVHPPRDAGALRGFLRRVLHNAWRQRARGESRRREREERSARAEATPATDELIEHLALHRRVVDAVQALEEPYRRALLLRYFEGLPPRAIAARLELPIRTVNTHLQRGLERLRVHFDEESGNDRRRWARALLPLAAEPAPRAAAPSVRALVRWALPVGAFALALVVWSRLGAQRSPALGAVHGPAVPTNEAAGPGDRPAGVVPGQRAPVDATSAPRLAGVVHTRTGEPVAGAEVELSYLPSASFTLTSLAARTGAFSRAASVLGTTRTDARGRFELELALITPDGAALRPWRVVVRATGFGTELRDDVFGTLDVELRRAGTLELGVLSENPCAGARLVLTRQGVRDPVFEGATDDQGRAVVGDLAPGLYSIQATPREDERALAIDVVVREGERVEHTLRTRPGLALAGEVRARRDGRAIPGACVRAGPDRETTTDADGRFHLGGLLAGRGIELTARVSGFAPLVRALTGDEVARNAPGKDAIGESTLVLELEDEGRARGTVLSADGAPVGGAWILADSSEARSGADGRFELAGLAPGTCPLLFVRAPGHAPWVAAFPGEIAAGELELGPLRLAAPARLAGRVRTRSGAGLAGARVELEALDELPTQGSAATVEPRGRDAGTSVTIVSAAAPAPAATETTPGPALPDASPLRNRSVRADAQGRFRLVDLAPGRYRVHARAAGQCTAPELELELAAGEERTDVELVYAEGERIAGRVVGSEGEAVPGAWVLLSASGAGLEGGAAHLSDLDGRFELAGLAAGVYELEVSFHGTLGSGAEARTYARAFVHDLRPPVRELEVRLPRDLSVAGVLRDEDDRPIADVYVEARDEAGRRSSEATDREGRFRVSAAEGTSVVLRVGPPVARGPADSARPLPRWSGELHGVAAGSRDVVLRATRAADAPR